MKFLSFQLEAMEETCRGFGVVPGLMEAIEETCPTFGVVPGLKEFSIRMTIKMSKVLVVCILQYR